MTDRRTSSSPSHSTGRRTGLGRLVLRRFKAFAGDTSGVTAIEFAAVGTPFFMLIFGLIEFGLAFFVNRILDYAALETTRLIRTGQAMKTELTQAQFKTTLCQKMTRVFCHENRLTIDIQTFSTFGDMAQKDSLLDDDGEIKEETAYEIGGSSDIVLARVIYVWPMITAVLRTDPGDPGGMDRRLYSTVVFRNEPFPW